MGQVRVICDSAADLPQNLINELDIQVVPIVVHLAGNSYMDGVDLFAEQFYSLLQETKEIPFTSQPAPMDYLNAYQKAIDEGATEILLISLSSGLSGSYQTAVLATSMLERTDVQIEVIDSRAASYAIGIQVVAAARAAKAGKSLAEVKAIAEAYRDHNQVFFLVDTLEYLQKGGRIGKASALIGSLLNIKPILSLNKDGIVYAHEKVRGKNKAVNRLFELGHEVVPSGPVSIGVMHAQNEAEANKWVERAKQEFDVKEIVLADIGPVIGTHAGPGTVALVVAPYVE